MNKIPARHFHILYENLYGKYMVLILAAYKLSKIPPFGTGT